MSDRPSEQASATALVARALKEGLGSPEWYGRRLLLTGVHGLSQAELFAGLLPHASSTVEVDTGERAAKLAGVPVSNGTLIPYLVVEPGQPTSDNSGDAGFAATLRTQFLVGAAGNRVLLILADRPDETVTTASDDAAGLPELTFGRLLDRIALERLQALPARSSLLHAVMSNMRNHTAAGPGKYRLEAFESLVIEHGGGPDRDIGEQLWRLGEYLRDRWPPHAGWLMADVGVP